MSEVPPPAELDAADLDGYYDKFYVHDIGEIRHHLQRLAGERCALTVRAEGSADSMATMLLRVDEGSLWIDVPSTRKLLDAWLGAHQLREQVHGLRRRRVHPDLPLPVRAGRSDLPVLRAVQGAGHPE